jgi:hypothetical protein
MQLTAGAFAAVATYACGFEGDFTSCACMPGAPGCCYVAQIWPILIPSCVHTRVNQCSGFPPCFTCGLLYGNETDQGAPTCYSKCQATAYHDTTYHTGLCRA